MPMFTRKVILEGIQPPIWRRFVVPAGISLSQLHQAVASSLAGKGACPPEDCGGVWGYQRVVSAAQDPNHPEHREVRE
jgi:hypothetical protein